MMNIVLFKGQAEDFLTEVIMVINFMEFKDENALQKTLEQQLKIGSATVEDVLLFCKENKLKYSEPTKTRPHDPEQAQKHEITIYCGTRAPAGKRDYFRLSNLKYFYLVWGLFFLFATWSMRFYFDNNILSEIEVNLIRTWF